MQHEIATPILLVSIISIDVPVEPNTFCLLPLVVSHSAMFTPAAANGITDYGVSTYFCHLLEMPPIQCQPSPSLVL